LIINYFFQDVETEKIIEIESFEYLYIPLAFIECIGPKPTREG
jgi:hypothetical protein